MEPYDLSPIKFTGDELAPVQIDVTLGDAPYVLKQADESAAIALNNARAEALVIDEDGNVRGMKGGGHIPALFVSRCLFQKRNDGGLSPVSFEFVQGLLPHVVDALYKRAKAISRIDVAQDEAALVKQIELLQKQLDALRKNGSPVKN